MSNLQARPALERANRLLTERPAAGRKPNAKATAVWRDGLRCDITGPNGERAASDMPEPMGGTGSAANPGWYLRAAVASCAATAIAMRAAMQGIELGTLEVEVESYSDARGLVGIEGVSTALQDMRVSIKISAAGVAPAVLQALAAAGEATSPIGCTLKQHLDMSVDVSVV